MSIRKRELKTKISYEVACRDEKGKQRFKNFSALTQAKDFEAEIRRKKKRGPDRWCLAETICVPKGRARQNRCPLPSDGGAVPGGQKALCPWNNLHLYTKRRIVLGFSGFSQKSGSTPNGGSRKGVYTVISLYSRSFSGSWCRGVELFGGSRVR